MILVTNISGGRLNLDSMLSHMEPGDTIEFDSWDIAIKSAHEFITYRARNRIYVREKIEVKREIEQHKEDPEVEALLKLLGRGTKEG